MTPGSFHIYAHVKKAPFLCEKRGAVRNGEPGRTIEDEWKFCSQKRGFLGRGKIMNRF